MKENDIKIEELKAQIEKQKDEMGKPQRYSLLTDNILKLEGYTYNLHVLQVNELQILACKLHNIIETAKELEFGPIEFNNFLLSDYLEDIKSKLSTISYKEKLKKLKLVEDKLTKLLSAEKQTSLAIDELAKLI